MKNFEQSLIDLIQKKVLSEISNTDLVRIEYRNRFEVPQDFLNEVYSSIDLEKVKARFIENLENEMADKIANKMIAEYSNDIKQILSNRELREELRCYAREKIKGICEKTFELN